MSLIIATRAAGQPLTVAQLKDQLEIRDASTNHDAKLVIALAAAVGWVEQVTRRDLVSRVWDYYLPAFPTGQQGIMLPKAPVISVAYIKYTDVTASPELLTLATTVYGTDSGLEPGLVYLKYNQAWPAASRVHNAVNIRFTSGYATGTGSPEVLAEFMPAELKAAVLMVAADLFEHREANLDMQTYENRAVKQMLAPFKIREL